MPAGAGGRGCKPASMQGGSAPARVKVSCALHAMQRLPLQSCITICNTLHEVAFGPCCSQGCTQEHSVSQEHSSESLLWCGAGASGALLLLVMNWLKMWSTSC